MNNKQKHSAFTIIEILFVIAITGVIMSLGLSLYEQYVKKVKITKTALEIQKVLKAATYYYSTNEHKWPDSGDTSQCPNPALCNYLPLPTLQDPWYNPWGYPYEWQTTARSKVDLFTVTTKTPSKKTAQKIEAILPNTSLDPNDNTKTVSLIGPPGQTLSPKNLIYFGGIGETSGSSGCLINNRDFFCPKQAPNPTVHAMISNFSTHEYTIIPAIKIFGHVIIPAVTVPATIKNFSVSTSSCEGSGVKINVTCDVVGSSCNTKDFLYIVSCSP